jgi:hypothetical protein
MECSYVRTVGSTSCKPAICHPGYYLNGPLGECQPCSVGTYQPYSNISLSSCYPCHPGMILTRTRSCIIRLFIDMIFNIGTYESQSGSSLCSLCGIESYQPSYGSAACLYCATVTLSTQIGATICHSNVTINTCNHGEYLNIESCVSCPIGRYQPYSSVALTECYYCQPGSYSSTIGGGNCTSCSIGSYQSSYGQTSCVSCSSVTTFGSLSCPSINITTCGTGQYLDEINNQERCEWCPAGSYQPFTQSRLPSCLSCPPGMDNLYTFMLTPFVHLILMLTITYVICYVMTWSDIMQ